uniref:NR LBD domain-containing protein n=1 Tax=Meleagris gallopavo TaxID=9103 RepID=A0A803XSU9_MELGA
MRDMRMDKTELGCLRAIILFNPAPNPNPNPTADAKGLSNPAEVEVLREKVYAALESYCKQKYPEQQGRWGSPKMTQIRGFLTQNPHRLPPQSPKSPESWE